MNKCGRTCGKYFVQNHLDCAGETGLRKNHYPNRASRADKSEKFGEGYCAQSKLCKWGRCAARNSTRLQSAGTCFTKGIVSFFGLTKRVIFYTSSQSCFPTSNSMSHGLPYSNPMLGRCALRKIFASGKPLRGVFHMTEEEYKATAKPWQSNPASLSSCPPRPTFLPHQIVQARYNKMFRMRQLATRVLAALPQHETLGPFCAPRARAAHFFYSTKTVLREKVA